MCRALLFSLNCSGERHKPETRETKIHSLDPIDLCRRMRDSPKPSIMRCTLNMDNPKSAVWRTPPSQHSSYIPIPSQTPLCQFPIVLSPQGATPPPLHLKLKLNLHMHASICFVFVLCCAVFAMHTLFFSSLIVYYVSLQQPECVWKSRIFASEWWAGDKKGDYQMEEISENSFWSWKTIIT